MRHRNLAATLFVLLAAAAMAGSSSAAQLQLHPQRVAVAAAAPACTAHAAPATTGASVGVIELTLPASCDPMAGRLVAYRADGGILAEGVVPQGAAPGGRRSVPLDRAVAGVEVAGVALVMDGRHVPASWSWSPPVTGSDGVTVSVTWRSYSPTSFCATIRITTDSPTPLVWRVSLDLRPHPFNGGHTATADYSITGAVPDPPGGIVDQRLALRGDTVTNRTVARGQVRTVLVCDDAAPPPAQDPAASRLTSSGPTGSKWRACMSFVVTGIAADDLYRGWSYVIDVEPLRRFIRDRGHVPAPEAWAPVEALDVVPLTVSTSRVSGRSYAAGIRRGQQFRFEACANGAPA